MKSVELLAPAGNYESFLGAVHAGADAVYLGGSKFGARAFADNFQTDQLCQAIRYAHLHHRKVYLTLNTLIKEKEFSQLYDYVRPFYEAGLDGVIVQDMGVFSYIRRCFPDLPLHVSTQMTVTGVQGAAFLKEQGAQRIVPARELSLEEIKLIKKETGLSIETFIHGAMCYCYSGQCLFSSILGGRSGNRGKCAQPCRLPYEIHKENTKVNGGKYPLSLKDMCTIDCLPDLIEAGIDSFKIEGRMKKPEYAAGVTAIYRKYIDLYYKKGREGYRVSREDKNMLESLYIRSEIERGYYYRHNGTEMITRESPGYSGSQEQTIQKVRNCHLDQKLRVPVSMKAVFRKGRPAILQVICEGQEVTLEGELVAEAQKRPVTRQNIEDGLRALGDSDFELQQLEIDAEPDIFYPLKGIKELRRKALATLTDQYTYKSGRKSVLPAAYAGKAEKKEVFCRDMGWRILVTRAEQLGAVLESEISMHRLYVDADLFEGEKISLDDLMKTMRQAKPDCRLFVVLPYILRKRDRNYLNNLWPVLQKADGCMVRNMEGYSWLKIQGYNKPISGDAGMYAWNRETQEFWKDKLEGICMPYELNEREQDQILLPGACEKIYYGYLPMMVTANCVAKTGGGCMAETDGRQQFSYSLQDRYHKKFTVHTNCRHCYNVIYNSVPLSLHGALEQRHTKGYLARLDFTLEDAGKTAEILKFFRERDEGCIVEPPYESYTTAHEKRGVE